MPERLVIHHLSKHFGGVIALKDLNLTLKAGEIHALCGENGAGKSTLIKCISGLWPHNSYDGSIYLNGKECRFQSSKDAGHSGIAVIYQELALVREMTVAENIFLGQEPKKGPWIDWHTMKEQCQNLLFQYDIDLNPNTKVEHLGIGQQQLVEILKALSKNSQILLLDEPTAALTDSEAQKLLTILRQLKEKGMSCLYISHRLNEVFDIADTITVIRDGSSISSTPKTHSQPHQVIQHMVGREIEDLFPKCFIPSGELILTVQNLTVELPERDNMLLSDLNFEIKRGEVLGIGGLMGAGRSELLLHLFCGRGTRCSGQILFRGLDFVPESAFTSIRQGIVMVSEDRKGSGLILDQNIGFNLSLSHLQHFVRHGMIQTHSEAASNHHYFNRLSIKAQDLNSSVRGLSGGNQQKVVLGKALMTEPELILLDEPTRGIDVGAKVEVYELINQLTAAGKAVILVSSELPELLGMSDRILMLCEGKQSAIFDRKEATQENLLTAAMQKY